MKSAPSPLPLRLSAWCVLSPLQVERASLTKETPCIVNLNEVIGNSSFKRDFNNVLRERKTGSYHVGVVAIGAVVLVVQPELINHPNTVKLIEAVKALDKMDSADRTKLLPVRMLRIEHVGPFRSGRPHPLDQSESSSSTGPLAPDAGAR